MSEAAPAPARRRARASVLAATLALTAVLVATPYRPWSMQQKFHRSTAPIRVVVAGRQSGKTHAAAEEVVRIMLRRPGTVSCLLMPTYKSTKGARRHLERALGQLPPGAWIWKASDAAYELSNGSLLYVRTADAKGVPTRGLTIDGVLWCDEAAYVPRSAWDAARFTQTAVAEPLAIITTTPAGRNWVYDEFQSGLPGPDRSPLTESFRFRSTDSPYCSATVIEDLKRKVGARLALQELNAYFLSDAHAAFDPEDLAKVFVPALPVRGTQLTLGVDLGKARDWTVVTLMNEFGEAWVVGRWRRVKWPDQEARIAELAERFGAIVVVDKHAGGGYGGAMFDYLERTLGEGRVFGVMTGALKSKATLVEHLKADVENHRLRILSDARGLVLRHELTFFEQHRIEGALGTEDSWRYHGPKKATEAGEEEDEGEDDETHDDCVLSLALAAWGRTHAWEDYVDPLAGDHSGFFAENAAAQGRELPGAAAAEEQAEGWGAVGEADDGAGWGAIADF